MEAIRPRNAANHIRTQTDDNAEPARKIKEPEQKNEPTIQKQSVDIKQRANHTTQPSNATRATSNQSNLNNNREHVIDESAEFRSLETSMSIPVKSKMGLNGKEEGSMEKLQSLQLDRKEKEGFTFHAKNEACLLCEELIGSSQKPFAFIPSCNHIVHVKCGGSWLLEKDKGHCPQCNSYCPPKSLMTPEQSLNPFAKGGVPIDRGNDPELTRLLEQTYGTSAGTSSARDGINEDSVEDISWKQKYAISGFTSIMKKEEIKIDRHYLESQEKGIEHLYDAKLQLAQIYHKIGLTTWKDLIDFGFRFEMLGDEKFAPVHILTGLYAVNYMKILEDLEVGLEDLLQAGFSAKELNELGCTVDNMLKYGLSKDIIDRSEFSFNDWYKRLGFEKKHISLFPINGQDMLNMKWDRVKVAKALKITDEECYRLRLVVLPKRDTGKSRASSSSSNSKGNTKQSDSKHKSERNGDFKPVKQANSTPIINESGFKVFNKGG